MAARKIVMGVVTGAHGVRGLVRVKSFTAEPSDLTAYGPLTDALGDKTFDLSVKGMAKGQVLAQIAGCGDRNGAEALRGTELYIDRALLPDADEDEFYHADLIGLDVVDGDGVPLGAIRGVFDFGSGDMLEVIGLDGASVFYEFSQAVVPSVDLDAGRVTVVPPMEEDGEGRSND